MKSNDKIKIINFIDYDRNSKDKIDIILDKEILMIESKLAEAHHVNDLKTHNLRKVLSNLDKIRDMLFNIDTLSVEETYALKDKVREIPLKYSHSAFFTFRPITFHVASIICALLVVYYYILSR